MERKLSLSNLDLQDKKVLMRVDFNVPLDKNGTITDDIRIRAALPSITYILEQGGALILMSHLGRPKGTRKPELSLAPCAQRLSELLNHEVLMAPDCIGPEVNTLVNRLKPGQVLLLENLRFHPEEEHPEKNPMFAQQLAHLGDVYVNDAFGAAHRVHASTVTIAQYFPREAAGGFLMNLEMDYLNQLLHDPARPFYAIIGGAKISSKMGIIKALIDKVDALLIGGGMAFTFLKAQGINIGNSIHEDDCLEEAKGIMDSCHHQNVTLLLPVDEVVTSSLDDPTSMKVVEIKQGIPAGFEGADIGPKTIEKFSDQLQNAKTIFWNGPLGVCEEPSFAKGTFAIAHLLAKSSAKTIIGGGDSLAAVHAAGLADKMDHLSTGGGASLEFIEQGTLPGIEALSSH
jgi:phosphoglycerate kinase